MSAEHVMPSGPCALADADWLIAVTSSAIVDGVSIGFSCVSVVDVDLDSVGEHVTNGCGKKAFVAMLARAASSMVRRRAMFWPGVRIRRFPCMA